MEVPTLPQNQNSSRTHTQRAWWQSQLDWHELNRASDPAWHDSQIRYYEAALFWNYPVSHYDKAQPN